MRSVRIAFILLAIVIFACEKKDVRPVEGEVELYLVESYSTVDGSSHRIDEASIQTANDPLIAFDDFISYNARTFTFELSEEATDAIRDLDQSVVGKPFAIVANRELIYSGYFWPSYLSASCEWVVIDPLSTSISNGITVKLGYPGPPQGTVIPDHRNDDRIIRIFHAHGKLLQ